MFVKVKINGAKKALIGGIRETKKLKLMKKIGLFVVTFSFPLLALCSVADPDSAAFYLRIALQHKGVKKVLEAEKSFKKAIGFNPSDNILHLEYGNFLVDQRKYFGALDEFSKILSTEPRHQEALQKLTNTNYLINNWTGVITYGTKLLDSNVPQRLKYMLGKAYYEEEDYGLAEKFLKESINTAPADADAMILLGKVYVELSNYKEALKMFNTALAENKHNSELIYQIGLLHYTLNQEREAIKYFELAAFKGYKNDLAFKENLGMAYLAVDVDKGVEILNKVLEKKPNDAEIRVQIAQAHYKAKNYQTAADAFYKLYQDDPTNNRALYMAGLAHQKKGDKILGVSLCDKAIKMDPTLAELKILKYSF